MDSQTTGYFVADVSGHGVSAAFLTSAVKVLLRQFSGPMYTPEETMRGIDSVMREADRRVGVDQLTKAALRHRAAPLEQAASLIAGDLRSEGRPALDDLLLLATEVRP